MKCTACKRNIAAGVEAQKMIVEYQQDDGTSKFFGYMMSDGPLSAATGRILRAWHHKHYHVARKREARGDVVTGRVLAGGPTAYDIGHVALSGDEMRALGLDPGDAALVSTEQYTIRLARLQQVARRVGKAVGDLTVLEAFWAEENGSPYDHGHQFRLEPYQLRAHLRYAHGVEPTPGASLAREHDRLHARMQQEATARLRGDEQLPERDWREQFTTEITKESHG